MFSEVEYGTMLIMGQTTTISWGDEVVPLIRREDMYRLSECNDPECESFAHCEYFTHSSIEDIHPPVAMPPRTFDLCQYTYHELAYLCGLDDPHYPVPATMDNAVLALWNDYKAVGRWAVPFAKRRLERSIR